jgi:hypothetical protein
MGLVRFTIDIIHAKIRGKNYRIIEALFQKVLFVSTGEALTPNILGS